MIFQLETNHWQTIFLTPKVGAFLAWLHYFGKPFRRGFQCDDETIRYPYKDSTISSNLLYFSGSGLNVLLILVFEYLSLLREASSSAQTRESRNQFNLRLYLRRVYCCILVWLFGGITSELITDISKFTAGRLRPHFIAVCNPIIADDTSPERGGHTSIEKYCSLEANRYKYITNYHCESGDPRDARLSFMSGHSSYAAYSAIFAVVSIGFTSFWSQR